MFDQRNQIFDNFIIIHFVMIDNLFIIVIYDLVKY